MAGVSCREIFERRVSPTSEPAARGRGSSAEQVRWMGFAIDRSRTIISAMILGRRVTAQDVAWLRREVFAGGVVTREEGDELFAVARAGMDNAPEWRKFFVEMIARHVIRQSE